MHFANLTSILFLNEEENRHLVRLNLDNIGRLLCYGCVFHLRHTINVRNLFSASASYMITARLSKVDMQTTVVYFNAIIVSCVTKSEHSDWEIYINQNYPRLLRHMVPATTQISFPGRTR